MGLGWWQATLSWESRGLSQAEPRVTRECRAEPESEAVELWNWAEEMRTGDKGWNRAGEAEGRGEHG